LFDVDGGPIPVSTKAGAPQFTVILRFASSRESLRRTDDTGLRGAVVHLTAVAEHAETQAA